ncbi:UNVERIFIED_CONTAM: hypothetical protein K2H54_026542 [Gekko kuhli]
MGSSASKEEEIKRREGKVKRKEEEIKRKEEEIKNLARAQFQELEATLRERDLQSITEEFQKDLDVLKNTTVDIAITGVSGTGKSSLVNTLRGIIDDEEDSAGTGFLETTKVLKAYSHSSFPKVAFWDLPGIGTPNFKAAEYTKKFMFEQYDLFIIVSSDRFTEYDVLLAHEIQKLKKKFYYVRAKVDVSLYSEGSRKNFTEEDTLEKIRRYCIDNLKEAGESNPRVFLISKGDLNMYDFPLLYKTLVDDLDDHKRHALIESMPGFSREILKKKEAAMDAHIDKVKFLSYSKASTHISLFSFTKSQSLPFVCDIAVVEEAMQHICKVFGFDEFSLNRFAHWAGMPFKELRSAIKSSPMASEITPEFVTDLLKKFLDRGQQITPDVPDSEFKWDNLTARKLNVITVSVTLKSFLQDVVKDAENVQAKAAECLLPNPSKFLHGI